MRVVTWNCCRGLESKAKYLTELHPDVAVISECARIMPPSLGIRADQWLWAGTDDARGLGVAVFGAYSVAPASIEDLPTFMLPARVDGPTPFNLVAVWAVAKGEVGYVRVLHAGLEKLADFICSGPTVLAGDLNSNAKFDDRCGPVNHTSVVRRLSGMGLVSAYHEFFAEEHGHETRPTFHLYRHTDKPFHLDFAFVPRGWMAHSRVEVGEAETWLARSDHAPLCVDVFDDGRELRA